MALFTIALFLATWLLYTAGERHSERELRAYVFPIKVEAFNFGIGKRLESFVQIKNSGQTPAYKLECVVRTFIGTFSQIELAVSMNEVSPPVSFLGPGDTSNFPARADEKLSEKLFANIVKGTEAIHIIGMIRYVDAFQKKRFTKFRSVARGRDGTMITARDRPDVLLFAHDKEGNDAN
jgi:hypothetical protein